MSFSHTEAWLDMLGRVAEHGRKSAPRGMATRELVWQQMTIDYPLTFPLRVIGRDFRDVIGVLEGLSLVGEFNVPEAFTSRVAKFGHFMDAGSFWGSYGVRAHGALGDMAELLTRDPDSRQAVITFFDSGRDLNRLKRDVPCTISAQFLLREGELDMGISMRSNDLWLGTPYDLVQFSILQASLAQALGVRVGAYVHRVGSMHLYERDAARLEGLAFQGGPPMAFPLWHPEVVADYVTPVEKIGAIQRRARGILLGTYPATTEFERWADSLLREER